MKSEKLLQSFTNFCKQNPDLRFFQALKEWMNAEFIYVVKDGSYKDTYYWEEKNK